LVYLLCSLSSLSSSITPSLFHSTLKRTHSVNPFQYRLFPTYNRLISRTMIILMNLFCSSVFVLVLSVSATRPVATGRVDSCRCVAGAIWSSSLSIDFMYVISCVSIRCLCVTLLGQAVQYSASNPSVAMEDKSAVQRVC